VRSATTGATAAVRGTIWQLLARLWRAEAVAQVPGVTVAIVNSPTNGMTDEQGFFRLEGDQFGDSVLRFTGGGADATLPVTLPFGGELTLINVDLSGAEIRVGERRLRFDGPITGIDCTANLMQVLSGERVPFRVRLQSGTSIVDQSGRPLSCGNLFAGRRTEVEGTVNAQGDVLAVTLRVSPEPSPQATPAPFDGTIVVLNCPTDLTVSRTGGSVRVNIGTGTVIQDENGMAIACNALSLGEGVRVQGTETSFGVEASLIERTAPAPTPTPSGTPTPTPN